MSSFFYVLISKYNGKWLASITVHIDGGTIPIGIDVGINTLATCFGGVTYANPRPLKRYERKLARANRRLSRRGKGSQNWYKAKSMLRSVHARISNIRNDAHQKATTDIIRRASAIGIETLRITNMLKR